MLITNSIQSLNKLYHSFASKDHLESKTTKITNLAFFSFGFLYSFSLTSLSNLPNCCKEWVENESW